MIALAMCVPILLGWGVIRWMRVTMAREAHRLAWDLDVARCTAEREKQLGHGVLRDAA